VFPKVVHNILPCKIGSKANKGGEFGFLGSHEESMMMEGDNVSWLGIPFLHEHVGARGCNEMDSIGSGLLHAIWGGGMHEWEWNGMGGEGGKEWTHNSHSHWKGWMCCTIFASPSLNFCWNVHQFNPLHLWGQGEARTSNLVFQKS
jgi:hypothetical protein